ncbi:MAG: hypothetical protein EXS36_19100 [Pedosphaera sp.]|nr:hypothetical protein [Pedosphaera sp.]
MSLVINFEMLDTEAVYEVSVDNVRWDAPEILGLPGQVKALYRSGNDSPPPPPDTDGDGLADSVETGTGVFLDATHTGTQPDNPDSDGDGQSDGDKLTAGTNPTAATETFRLEFIHLDKAEQPVLSWTGKSGRIYSVSFAEGLSRPETEFFPVPGLTTIRVESDGRVEVSDTSPRPKQTRFYRLSVHKP